MDSPNPNLDNKQSLSEAKRKLLQQRLARKRGGPKTQSTRAIPRKPKEATPHASINQYRIWLQHELDPDSSANTVTSSFIIKSGLNPALLEKSINRVVQRHEVLRSSYRLQNGELEQLIHDHRPITLETVSLPTESEMEKAAQAWSLLPFNLRDEPLLRIRLFQGPNTKAILILTVHDLVFDKWSLKQFWKEASNFYDAEVLGKPHSVPDLPIQYSDFAYWQKKQLEDGELNKQLEYWKEQLKAPPLPLNLPTDYPYPDTITINGKLERARISSDTTAALREFASQQDVSVSMLLNLVFSIILHRYSGESDILTSSPVANRTRRETADLIGFLLSTVVIRTDLSSQPTCIKALSQIKSASLEALENQDLPLDKIVEAVKPQRIAGRHPLVQTMFVFQREDEGLPRLSLAACDIESIFIHPLASKFDLTLFVAESGEGMESIAEYRTDLFKAETMQRFLAHFEVALKDFISNPNKKVSQLSYLTDSEQKQLLAFSQGPRFNVNNEPHLLAVISQRAKENPTACAVATTGETLTYQDLQRHSDTLASELIASGAKSNRLVGVLLNKSPQAIIAILAILKSGGAYLPIDPNYPKDRRNFIITDSEIEIIVTDAENARLIDGTSARTVLIDQNPEAEAASTIEKLPLPDDDDLAYLIYTSGSTGNPKGVQITHRNLKASTGARNIYYRSKPTSYLLVPSLSFDSSVAGIFWTLANGAQLVIPSSEELLDPDRLLALMRQRTVDTLLCVPTLYQQLLSFSQRPLGSLQTAIVAGESCSPELVSSHFRTFPNTALYNEYGPTETTVWASVHECSESDSNKKTVPIGKPIPNATLLILDPNRENLPVGHEGVLFIGGEGVGTGYLGHTNLTSERFTTLDDGKLYYKSGDKAKWSSDGELSFLGRDDNQVKVRGYRIETGEIENALSAHPSIESAVVVASPSSSTIHDWDSLLSSVPPHEIEAALSDLEDSLPPVPTGSKRSVPRKQFHLDLTETDSDFLITPRRAQRDWQISQTLAEAADDLEHLHKIAPSFVPGAAPGSDQAMEHVTQGRVSDIEIMEDWQFPIMEAMADYASESRGDVLEVGFGRGVSADLIQKRSVKSHTIIEMDDGVVENFYNPWKEKYPGRDIRLSHDRWQAAIEKLGLFDGIFFHTYPMNEKEFEEFILNSVTFAEHSFSTMAQHLKPGGVFTYFSGEIDSLSRRHQRKLLEHFSEISFRVVNLNVPENTRDAWWAQSIAVVKAVK